MHSRLLRIPDYCAFQTTVHSRLLCIPDYCVELTMLTTPASVSPGSDWSVLRINPRFLRLINPS
eukprot:4651000-Pyramimonas_sp.AAC.2